MTDAIEKSAEPALTRKDAEDIMMGILGIFATKMGEMFAQNNRHIEECVGVVRELDADNRGILLEFAKFKQLHRTEAELQWLNGIHGRAAMEAFKEAAGMTSFAKLMQTRVLELQAKRDKAINALPEGVASAPKYTWFCDHCPDGPGADETYETPEAARKVRDEHVTSKHPEQLDGGVVEATH